MIQVWPHEIAITLIPNDNGNNYLCSFCQHVSTSHPKHRSHLTQHKDLKYYVCVQPNCIYYTDNLDHLVEHVTTNHPIQQYTCYLCGKLTFSLDEICSHYYEHEIEEDITKTAPKYQCLTCKAQFACEKNLQQHLLTVSHDHICNECSKRFECERSLRRHLRIHAPEEFKCNICSKGFKTLAYLKTHRLTHNEDKPFVCEVCQVAFNRKDRLKRHSKIHGNHLFKCPLYDVIGCTKSFSRSDKLKMHINTHTSRLIKDVEAAEQSENSGNLQNNNIMIFPLD